MNTQRFHVFKSHITSIDFERYEGDLISAAGSVYYESKNLDNNQFAAELLLLIYPGANWMISSGAAFAESDLKQTDTDIITRFEHMPAIGSRRNWSIIIQLAGNHILETAISLRYYFGERESLRAHHRSNGYYSARFK